LEESKPSTVNVDADEAGDSPWSAAPRAIGWTALVLAFIESVCTGAMMLSGVRVALGFSSLLAAGAAGPARAFHANAVRIPMLWIAGLGACLNLLLYWNEERIRNNPSARWRLRPLTAQQRRRRRIQVGTALVTFVLIALEVITHPLFHHEL